MESKKKSYKQTDKVFFVCRKMYRDAYAGIQAFGPSCILRLKMGLEITFAADVFVQPVSKYLAHLQITAKSKALMVELAQHLLQC